MYDDVFRRLALDPKVIREIFGKRGVKQFQVRQSKRLDRIFNEVSIRKSEGGDPIRLFDEFLVMIANLYAIPGAGSWFEQREQEQKLAEILGLDHSETMKRVW